LKSEVVGDASAPWLCDNENMAGKLKKRPRDPMALAKLIGDIATGQTPDTVPDERTPCRRRAWKTR
jgi:hypothetical protein